MLKMLMYGAVLISAIFLSSSHSFAGSFSFSWGNDQPSASTHPAVTTKKNEPPANAQAHGYRAKRQYHYYPSSSVYHDLDRGMYFYLSGSNWRVSASLPTDLRLHLGSSVSIEMDTDKPYIFNAQHKKQYPPGQKKQKQDKKEKKLAKK